MKRDTKSENILTRYAAGERAFLDLDRDDGIYNFDGADLSDVRFSGSHFFATFRNANLTGADFSDCNVKTCDFSGADLTRATFFSSAIDAAIFEGAVLAHADFEEASEQGHVYAKGELPLR